VLVGHGMVGQRFLEALAERGLTATHRVVVLCEDGKRSAEVAEDLRQRGYQAAIVKGGMKAWAGDKMPTLPREAEEFHGPRRPGPLGQ